MLDYPHFKQQRKGKTMKTTYKELKQAHQAEINEFPMGFAFSDKQLEEGLKKLECTRDDVVGIGGGGFVRKTDTKDLRAMYKRHDDEMSESMKDDSFLISAIRYELSNHEYCITYDSSDTVSALNLDMDDPRTVKCFNSARKEYLEDCDY
jgi:hypothetical protein